MTAEDDARAFIKETAKLPAWPKGAVPVAADSPLRPVLARIRATVREVYPEHADHRLRVEVGGARLQVICEPCNVRLEKLPESP